MELRREITKSVHVIPWGKTYQVGCERRMKNRGKVQRKDELAIATQLTKRVRKDELKRFSQHLHAVSLVFLFFWNATTRQKSYQSYEAHLTSTSLRGPIHSQPFFKFEQSTCKFKICLWQPLSEKTWKISQSIKHQPITPTFGQSVMHLFSAPIYGLQNAIQKG